MSHRILKIVLFLIATTPLICAAGPHTPVDKWDTSRLYHAPFDDKFINNIIITKSSWPSKLLQHKYSKNKAYWYGVIGPDTTKNGPWSTKIFINNERKKPIQIDLAGHNNYPVKINWINEKLLYIQVWWGRIIGTDLIYDVEREITVSKEMIKDGRYLFYQHQESQKSQPNKSSQPTAESGG